MRIYNTTNGKMLNHWANVLLAKILNQNGHNEHVKFKNE